MKEQTTTEGFAEEKEAADEIVAQHVQDMINEGMKAEVNPSVMAATMVEYAVATLYACAIKDFKGDTEGATVAVEQVVKAIVAVVPKQVEVIFVNEDTLSTEVH